MSNWNNLLEITSPDEFEQWVAKNGKLTLEQSIAMTILSIQQNLPELAKKTYTAASYERMMKYCISNDNYEYVHEFYDPAKRSENAKLIKHAEKHKKRKSLEVLLRDEN